MKVWLPCVRGGSGVDIYTQRLAKGLTELGIDVKIDFYPHFLQYCPWLLRLIPTPPSVDVIVANSWNAFAFKRKSAALVVINHLCVFDPVLSPYKSRLQSLFHRTLVYYFEKKSYQFADRVIAVSEYTQRIVSKVFSGVAVDFIHNGIELNYFKPSEQTQDSANLNILFVGNLSRRKGADLLPKIMRQLGDGYVLRYTDGLSDANQGFEVSDNMHSLGKLNQVEILKAYEQADVVLFPTRAEGFGYAAVEAMACGKAVVATAITSLNEIIKDGVSGFLCPLDDVDCFVSRLKELKTNAELRKQLGEQARKDTQERFSLEHMSRQYQAVFQQLINHD